MKFKHVFSVEPVSYLGKKNRRGVTVACERDPAIYDPKTKTWNGQPRVYVQVAFCSSLDVYSRKKGREVALAKTKELVLIKDLPKYLLNVCKQNKVSIWFAPQPFALSLL